MKSSGNKLSVLKFLSRMNNALNYCNYCQYFSTSSSRFISCNPFTTIVHSKDNQKTSWCVEELYEPARNDCVHFKVVIENLTYQQGEASLSKWTSKSNNDDVAGSRETIRVSRINTAHVIDSHVNMSLRKQYGLYDWLFHVNMSRKEQ